MAYNRPKHTNRINAREADPLNQNDNLTSGTDDRTQEVTLGTSNGFAKINVAANYTPTAFDSAQDAWHAVTFKSFVPWWVTLAHNIPLPRLFLHMTENSMILESWLLLLPVQFLSLPVSERLRGNLLLPHHTRKQGLHSCSLVELEATLWGLRKLVS